MKKIRIQAWRAPTKLAVLVGFLGGSIGLMDLRSNVMAVHATAVQDTLQQAELTCVQFMPALANPDTSNAQYKAARECIHSLDEGKRKLPLRSVRGDFSRLADIFLSIPEYHDEQRLAAGLNALGPKAYAYASPTLDDFEAQWEIRTHGPRGLLVGYVFVDLLTGETLPDSYKQLHLVRGMNCVWLSRQTAQANPSGGWTAKILPATVPPMPQLPFCSPNTPSPYTNALDVSMQREPGTTADDYPPVIRFGESQPTAGALLGKPLIGVKCLDAWCEIGARPFVPMPALSAGPSNGPGPLPLRARIKGWHDEQVLTDRNPPNFLFTPVIRAAIVPADGVEDLSPANFQSGWKPVARIVFGTPTAGTKYASWGLRQGVNLIEIRQSSPTKWEVRMTPPTGVPLPWRYLHREQHVDVGVPGTARFRWTHADDGFWVPCGVACCQVEG